MTSWSADTQVDDGRAVVTRDELAISACGPLRRAIETHQVVALHNAVLQSALRACAPPQRLRARVDPALERVASGIDVRKVS